MLHRFNFVNFSEGPPATNRESSEGERGARALSLCAFSLSSPSALRRRDESGQTPRTSRHLENHWLVKTLQQGGSLIYSGLPAS
jgi:hypothetical protein